MQKKILILYDYFDPAYKAGGPIRSLANLVQLMEDKADFYILTTNHDHDGTKLEVTSDQWIPYGKSSHVMYLSHGKKRLFSMKRIISELSPDIVYINGIFSPAFVVSPLLWLRGLSKTDVIIAPRGMLQAGALQIKALKKKLYLKTLKYLLRMQSSLIWHATDEQEVTDITNFMKASSIKKVGNVPKFHESITLGLPKNQNCKFVSISLLTTKKNHISFLQALAQIPTRQEVVYHIYGPISNSNYFDKLNEEISKMPSNIKVEYRGIVHPKNVANTLLDYDFYVLTSFGENFGHSIYEAFNNGIPVIISDQTPWRNLHQKKAGWDVDLQAPEALKNVINEAIEMDDLCYQKLQKGARKMAEDYINKNDFVMEYKQLFSLK